MAEFQVTAQDVLDYLGYEDTPDKQARFRNEVRLFRERWKDVLAKGDPYYNPNLTLKKPDFTLRQEDEQMK